MPAALSAAVLLLLASITWSHAQAFVTDIDLWNDVLQPDKNPHSWLAKFNLGADLSGQMNQLQKRPVADRHTDPDLYETGIAAAATDADTSEELLKQVISDASAPATIHYQCHFHLGMLQLQRADFPDAHYLDFVGPAESEFQKAIDGQRQANANGQSPDALPLLQMGILHVQWADYLFRHLPPLAATQPDSSTLPATAPEAAVIEKPPATRPTTDAEHQVRNHALVAADYLAAQGAPLSTCSRNFASRGSNR